MPSSARVERRIWWFTVSNAADKSRRITTDERDKPLATQRDTVTVSRAISVSVQPCRVVGREVGDFRVREKATKWWLDTGRVTE